MSTAQGAIVIDHAGSGYQPEAAVDAVRAAGWLEAARKLAPGPFGPQSGATLVLEQLALAVDLGRRARGGLEAEMTASRSDALDAAPLSVAQRQLLSAFQLVVTCDDGCARIARATALPEVEGELALEGTEELLSSADGLALARRFLQLGARFVELTLSRLGTQAAEEFPRATAAFLTLLGRTVRSCASAGALGAASRALAARPLSVAGQPYLGLARRAATEEGSGLLPVELEAVVGNREYLEAGLRLARDVAGYDFERRENPKRINPILFGLGAPGCGKTLTAHAIGRYFLRFCGQRAVPAKFVVVRRSDWASSYQNASAANLIRLFREHVYGFEGVTGVYWPDIDTALASRDSKDLRAEEKHNLGAVFGLFDGTLIPKDGKWFLICDANTTHMDEAARSRIAQNPFVVSGPVSADDYTRLLRDVMLKDVAGFTPLTANEWHALGQRLSELALSGRNVESIANNVRAAIQDFEYPDEYFGAGAARRRGIIQQASRALGYEALRAEVERFVTFTREARSREEEAAFQREVDDIVRRLNAGQRAAARLGAPEP